jgi:ribonuclease P protein component
VTRVDQTYFPAQQPQAQAAPRVPFAHGDQKRPENSSAPPRQGPQEAQRLEAKASSEHNPSPIAIERLSVRREFLYVADGEAERRKTLVVQARRRPVARPAAGAGFTATKKVGGSVIRNRARRRLREAVRMVLPVTGVSGVDYVFIARQETPDCPWPRLLDDMEKALLSLRRRIAAEPLSARADPPPPAKV